MLDNSTRWNSTFYSIERGLKLKGAIRAFVAEHEDDLVDDILDEDEWQTLEEVVAALKPLEYFTSRLQGNTSAGSHGAIWETLPTLDYLMRTFEDHRAALEVARLPAPSNIGPRRSRNSQINNPVDPTPLEVAYQNAWEVLARYNSLTDDSHEIYAAATLANPCLRKAYFSGSWTHEAVDYIQKMVDTNKRIWEVEYRQFGPERPLFNALSTLDNFLATNQYLNATTRDQFTEYIEGAQVAYTNWEDHNIFEWWANCPYPDLKQWAWDVLSAPATSAEVERVFSSARRLLTDDRNRMGIKLVAMLVQMKRWQPLL